LPKIQAIDGEPTCGYVFRSTECQIELLVM
jgi:hypothetical protein